ncbi:helix-turn-helix domain-containing protein [Sphingomonas sp. CFBP 8760]|uniref:helix-turn-helix domain-containing protein n=1 Tax=Sphingomonas sp. CFBP 8760 TaxID=2775282 RepID=UPI0017807586|nr:helix-turn-helix transcriptional regulator [Sphingomonas sp. CFBP 8760]MBD8548027.1 helix-turn-helix transcriptional regulator [Sphingomonas sp. CFBP 8760]
MFNGDRLRNLMATRGLSQSELARRVGVSQTTIAKLVAGRGYGSKHLHRIARELRTTPAYLTGEIDDPEEDAPPPPPAPTVQMVMMPVALPSEEALARMFEGLLEALPGLEGPELARELATLLPTALGSVRGPLIEVRSETDDAQPVLPDTADAALPLRRRA